MISDGSSNNRDHVEQWHRCYGVKMYSTVQQHSQIEGYSMSVNVNNNCMLEVFVTSETTRTHILIKPTSFSNTFILWARFEKMIQHALYKSSHHSCAAVWNLLITLIYSNHNQPVTHYLADYWKIMTGGQLIGTSPTVRANAAIFKAIYIQPQATWFA